MPLRRKTASRGNVCNLWEGKGGDDLSQETCLGIRMFHLRQLDGSCIEEEREFRKAPQKGGLLFNADCKSPGYGAFMCTTIYVLDFVNTAVRLVFCIIDALKN